MTACAICRIRLWRDSFLASLECYGTSLWENSFDWVGASIASAGRPSAGVSLAVCSLAHFFVCWLGFFFFLHVCVRLLVRSFDCSFVCLHVCAVCIVALPFARSFAYSFTRSILLVRSFVCLVCFFVRSLARSFLLSFFPPSLPPSLPSFLFFVWPHVCPFVHLFLFVRSVRYSPSMVLPLPQVLLVWRHARARLICAHAVRRVQRPGLHRTAAAARRLGTSLIFFWSWSREGYFRGAECSQCPRAQQNQNLSLPFERPALQSYLLEANFELAQSSVKSNKPREFSTALARWANDHWNLLARQPSPKRIFLALLSANGNSRWLLHSERSSSSYFLQKKSRFAWPRLFAIGPQCHARLQPLCFATLYFIMTRSASYS